jgi:O-antigen/teichoic acid export membrane protein
MRRFSLTVLRNSTFGIAAQVAIKLLSFGFSVLIVRHLGAGDFGQYSAVLAFGMIFAFISDLGLSPYTVREVARWRDKPDGLEQANTLYGNVLILRLMLALLATILMTTAAWLTGRPLLMVGAIALSALGLIMYGVQGTSEAVLAGFERLDISAQAKVLYQLIFVLFGAAVLLLGAGYYGLIIANLAGIALMTYFCWRSAQALGLHPRPATARSWPALVRAGLPFGVIGFALGLSYKFDSVLLNIFRSDAETGYYAAVYNLIFSAVILSNVLNTALYPSLARESVTTPHRLPRIYEHSLRYLMILALPIAVGGWAFADQFVPALFTSNYLPAVPAFQILIWVVPLMYASEFLGYIVVIADKESHVARAVAVSTGFNVVLNLILVPRFGLLAAAVMTVVTEAVLVGQYVWMLRAVMQQFNWGKILLRPLLAAAIMGALVWLVRSYVPLLASVAIGAAVYLMLLLVLGVTGKDEVHFVRSILFAPGTTSGQ